jgi:hypothetical protein
VRKQIHSIRSAQFVEKILKAEVDEVRKGLELTFRADHAALERLCRAQLGKTILFTDNADWPDQQIVLAYRSQYHIEDAFKRMKNPHFLGWSPMFHWTDSKIAGLVPSFHPPFRRQRMRQLRPVARPLHLLHQPVVTSAGFQGDFRAWRKILEKCPEHRSIMPDSDRSPVFAVFVHRHEQREFLVRVTSDKPFHSTPPLLPRLGSVYSTAEPRCGAFIRSLPKIAMTPIRSFVARSPRS